MLKQNLFKNVSNGPAFCDKKGWIWPQWYDWNKNEKNTLIRSSFPLPHMNFQTILRPKEISAKFLSEKNGPLKPFWFFCFIYWYSWEIKLFFPFSAPDFVNALEDDEHVYFFFREAAVEHINCGKVSPIIQLSSAYTC